VRAGCRSSSGSPRLAKVETTLERQDRLRYGIALPSCPSDQKPATHGTGRQSYLPGTAGASPSCSATTHDAKCHDVPVAVAYYLWGNRHGAVRLSARGDEPRDVRNALVEPIRAPRVDREQNFAFTARTATPRTPPVFQITPQNGVNGLLETVAARSAATTAAPLNTEASALNSQPPTVSLSLTSSAFSPKVCSLVNARLAELPPGGDRAAENRKPAVRQSGRRRSAR
jgi:hypothetical protein